MGRVVGCVLSVSCRDYSESVVGVHLAHDYTMRRYVLTVAVAPFDKVLIVTLRRKSGKIVVRVAVRVGTFQIVRNRLVPEVGKA